jgi:vanillate O-demethylase monooxygenase subunit
MYDTVKGADWLGDQDAIEYLCKEAPRAVITDTSIHYFWGMVRQFKPHDQDLTARIREGQGKIFSEDLEMLERQQKNILANPARKLKVLSIDAGGVMSRRVIDRLLELEKAV